MRPKSFSDMRCSIARTLDLVGSWWSLLIIRDAMMGARRFTHFERSLGIAKNTLAARLEQLVAAGVLVRVTGPSGAGFDEYRLTEQGRALAPVLVAMAQWGDRWAAHPDGPSTRLVAAGSGEPLPALWPRDADGHPLPLEQISLRRADDAPPLPWAEDEGG